MPSTVATAKRKEDFAKKLCDIATGSAVPQRTACIPWILAGDFDVDQGTMSRWCQAFIEKGVPCFSKSEWPQDADAQKSDFALSQGIALKSFKSWLGIHSQPCASDIRDAVVVMGAFKAKAPQSTFTTPPLANSGVLQPADTGDTLHEAIQGVIENISLSAMADNGTLLRGDMPKLLHMAMHIHSRDRKRTIEWTDGFSPMTARKCTCVGRSPTDAPLPDPF